MKGREKLHDILKRAICVLGMVAIVAIGGLTVPFDVEAASLESETVSMLATSNASGRPYNPVRDTVFKGNQQKSDIFRNIGSALFVAGIVGAVLDRKIKSKKASSSKDKKSLAEHVKCGGETGQETLQKQSKDMSNEEERKK